jgi:hypothetical protein
MAIDASIPLHGLLINRNDELLKQQRLRAGDMQMQQQEEETQNRRRLGDLLPKAVAGDQAAIADIYSIDPNIAMKLDERQKAAVQERIGDLSNAVRWADTPEKWQYVQQHYSQEGVDLSPYRFEDRERGLVALGKIGDYLKPQGGNQPSSVREYEYAKGQGFTGSYMDFQNQMGSPIMVDNGDGTKTLYPRSMLSGRQTPPPPPPGFVIDGGPSPNGSGGFPGSGYGGQ